MLAPVSNHDNELGTASLAEDFNLSAGTPVVGVRDHIGACFVHCHLRFVTLIFVQAAQTRRSINEFSNLAQLLYATAHDQRV